MLKVTNLTSIRLTNIGTLWVEAVSNQEDLSILSFNRIWYEVQSSKYSFSL